MKRGQNSVHVDWTEERLSNEITELQAALDRHARAKDPETRWARTLVRRCLEDRRRMLAALRRTGVQPPPQDAPTQPPTKLLADR